MKIEPEQNSPPIYDNSLYRRWIVRPVAKKMAPRLYSLGFTGNGVCWLKLAFGLAGAFMLVSRSPLVCFVGMLLLQVNFYLDAADGEVARMRGQAGSLSGEYIDKLFDHLPKTAMYFMWGFGAFQLTGNTWAVFCGAFFAAWNIYPRFCDVETLLERVDKDPEVYDKPEFKQALAGSFSVREERGRADFILTMFVHPAINILTIFFIIEIFFPVLPVAGDSWTTRTALLGLYTLVGIFNFIRKGIRFFKLLQFS